ncbi:Phospholipase/carboxylesterase [Microthyrium microscopicum]|uniref:Acyl-protein thioesterase 1 n=1 Tax=Microthyrium microscopicum TaxID=703497 RepID=A0A6A6UAQ9_9PEZI|nr:Phospholipase/carboxylesterase [Microthyrium microscopicum]
MAPAIIIPASGNHTATLIVAHGLGDSGAGWAFLAQQLNAKKFSHVKFIFPNAPQIPITLNGGMSMPGWYDIKSLSGINAEQDKDNIVKSQQVFHKMIDAEVDAGIPADRIAIGGFSQGGAMSLFSGLTYPKKLAGIFGLSCYLLLQKEFQQFVAEGGDANKETEIFMAHGSDDPVVMFEYGKLSAEVLKKSGYNVDFKVYQGMGHSACPEELEELETYLGTVIPATTTTAPSQGNL